jgi:tetratricopeptide (TPR) repeat protein
MVMDVTATRHGKIASLWDSRVDRLHGQDRAAAQLLALCAYLAPEPVPLDLFSAHPGLLPEPLSSAAADPLALNGAVAILAGCQLADRAPGGLQVHRPVQAAVRAREPSPGQVPGQPGWPAGGPLAAALTLLCAGVPVRTTAVPQAWPRWAALLPHVLAVNEHLAGAAAPGRATMGEAAWLLDGAGIYLRAQGRLADAKPLLERALAISEASQGPAHPAVASRLNNLALILRDLGQPGQARPLLERALAITEDHYGPDHPAVATDLNNLAAVMQALGRYEEALPRQERALAIDEASYGSGHPEVATDLNNLAVILQVLGQPGTARPLLERALAITEDSYGLCHPAVTTALTNLVAIQPGRGRPGTRRPPGEGREPG